MEAEQTITLEAFAEQVRKDCIEIMSRCAFGHTKEAGELAAMLCTRAGRIVQGATMAEELAAGPDLSTLGAWMEKPGIQE